MSTTSYNIIQTEEERLDPIIRMASRASIRRAAGDYAKVIRITQRHTVRRGIRAMLINVLCALHQCQYDTVFIGEHDVLYPEGYFDYRAAAGDVTYAARALYLLPDGWAKRGSPALSSCAGNRDALIEAFDEILLQHCTRGKVSRVEPKATGLRIGAECTVDIRHGANYTGLRTAKCYLDDKYWGNAAEWWRKLGRVTK